jgi:hypothetical protein
MKVFMFVKYISQIIILVNIISLYAAKDKQTT